MEDLLKSFGIHDVKDYDDLTPDEQETYRKMLEIVESSSITLEDFKKHISAMRQSVEFELAKLPERDPRSPMLKGRLLNYIIFEAFFDRPQRAREMLRSYSQKSRTKL